MQTKIDLSFVIPVKDEQDTIAELVQQIAAVVADLELSHEVVLVDDGSTDRSWEVMQELVQGSASIQAVRLRRNFGKAAALASGFAQSHGDIVFTMDADLQDRPDQIPKFLEELESGVDVVSGWKERRNDPRSKTLPSQLFNLVVAKLSKIPLKDFNCGFKAYRREVLDKIRLYGELHRFVPVLAHDLGFKISEVSVLHDERKHGQSKYGWERYARGLLDLLTVLVTTRYLQKPAHFFGGIGILAGFVGFLILTYLSGVWLLGGGPIGTRPLFSVGVLCVILSIQMISIGILAELINRNANARPISDYIALKIGDDR